MPRCRAVEEVATFATAEHTLCPQGNATAHRKSYLGEEGLCEIRRCFPMMRIDYIRVPGKEWVQAPTNKFETVEIREPLLTAVWRAQAEILA